MLERLEAAGATSTGGTTRRPALHAALAVARELAPLAEPRPASEQIGAPAGVLDVAIAAPIADDDPFAVARAPRARGGRRDARRRSPRRTPRTTIRLDDRRAGGAVRRWIDEQTFVAATRRRPRRPPARRSGGPLRRLRRRRDRRPRRKRLAGAAAAQHLLSAGAAQGARLAVGEGPPRAPPTRGSSICSRRPSRRTLGLDLHARRRSARDAVDAARRDPARAAVDGRPASPSTTRASSSTKRCRSSRSRSIRSTARSATWAELRTRAVAGAMRRRSTAASARAPARAWSVSALETYLDCPFKFFAQHVLRLEEEPDDEEVMDPRRQGQFVHEVFEAFFTAWQDAGHRAITPDNLDDGARDVRRGRRARARARCRKPRRRSSGRACSDRRRPPASARRCCGWKPSGRSRSSSGCSSTGSRASSRSTTAGGPRAIALRGKADRLDLLADGTFRLIDYKLGWPPQRGAGAAAADLRPLRRAAARRPSRPAAGRSAKRPTSRSRGRSGSCRCSRRRPIATKVLAEAQQRLADTVDAIERGEFPPTPDDVYRCETCSFAAVCRKDYVGDV